MKKILLSFSIILFFLQLQAQKVTISGYIDDSETGEKLLAANIYNKNAPRIGTISNVYGFYSLTLDTGTVVLITSYVGYESQVNTIRLLQDTVIHFSLSPVIQLEEIEITGNKYDKNIETTQMGLISVPVTTLKKLPVLFGETDILKSIQLLPGVQSGSEGTSGFYVRGGGPDQNLILLDGVPVYNVNHLFGFFSVFNADAISSVVLVKGGFPAKYGGRLSSVLDIRMKEGNLKKFSAEGSVGIISANVTIQGPIKTNQTSYIISLRRTYIDLLAKPVIRAISRANDMSKLSAGYYFYDINAKINHKINDKLRLFYSIYTGSDKAYVKIKNNYDGNLSENNFKLSWGNITNALRLNYKISAKHFSNTTLTYSRFKFLTSMFYQYSDNTTNLDESYKLNYTSGINDITLHLDFDYYPNSNHTIKYGISSTYHTFNPGVNAFNSASNISGSLDTTFGNKKIFAIETDLFIQDDFSIGQRVKLNAGIHYNNFTVFTTNYNSVQPRLSARLLLTPNWSVKLAYSLMNQNVLLLTNTTIGLPTDLWLPVTDNIKPLQSNQFAIGTAIAFPKNIEISIEAFYKNMHNLIEYKEGASFFSFNDDWQDKIEIGKGWSYGVELLTEKKIGKITGWVGYTWSKSLRKFNNISFGNVFPYTYDRRHDVSIVFTYKQSKKIDYGFTWVYGTGNAFTLATQKYQSAQSENEFYNYPDVEYFGNRNNFRMPAYHRLDLGISLHREKSWGQRTLSIGIYNVYNRKNPLFLQFETVDNQVKLVKYSLFPIIPSISYSFKFK